jgi:hypothetical protein
MTRRFALCLVLLLMLTACSFSPPASPPTDTPTPPTGTPPPTGDFIPFADFFRQVDAARFEDYEGKEDVVVRDAAAFDEMRQHILRMYDGVEQVSSFVLDGQYVDCITIDSQPSVRLQNLERAEREAPEGGLPDGDGEGEPPGVYERIESPLRAGLTDAYGNAVRCADGSIPMMRLTLETLTRFETLDAFFSKGPDGRGQLPDPELSDDDHAYAASRQNIDNFGGNSWLNLWSPSVTTKNDFSLSQQWYAGGVGTAQQQTIEGGWQAYPTMYKDNNARLFIFYTADNYGTKKCYNLTCAAFVQTNSNLLIGGAWSGYSSTGGAQVGFEMQWKMFGTNWWLFIRGPGRYEAVGYYPASLYGTGQLSRNATQITYGGETTSSTGTYPPMGSGAFSNQGWQRAAFQNTIFYIPRNENGGVGVWATLSEIENAPSCYTMDITPFSSGGNWGTYFFYGGPGGNC